MSRHPSPPSLGLALLFSALLAFFDPAALLAAVLVPGTFVGGTEVDVATSLAVLPGGDVVVVGNSFSADFPATAGSPAGDQDVWVARFDSRFETRRWSRILGGSAFDEATAVAFDSSGNIFLTGNTDSTDFPTSFAYDSSASGLRDAFLVKLNGASGAISFSTYLGGGADELARDLVVDAAGRPTVVGTTHSGDFPQVSPISSRGSSQDAFLSQFSADGASLLFSTYLGDVFRDDARAVALDSSGNFYIAIYQGDPDGSGLDHNRVIKLSAISHTLVYDYLFGYPQPYYADGAIVIEDLAVDSLGRATFAGTTDAATDLLLASPRQASLGGGTDLFFARLDATGSTLELSSYLGGEGNESAARIALGSGGDLVVAGTTESLDFPLLRPLDAELNGNEITVSRFSGDGATLLSSTFFGGANNDFLGGLTLGADGVPYLAGGSESPDLAISGLLPSGFTPTAFLDGFAARLAEIGVARFLPRRSVSLPELTQLPAPYNTIDFDADGDNEEVTLAPGLPLVASTATSRGSDGQELLSLVLGSLGGVTIAGVLDVDRDGENELILDDPSRDRGSFEGWLLDHRDQDVDLVIRGSGGEDGFLAADLDSDGEVELVLRDPGGVHSTFDALGGSESPGDADPDVIFLGGRPRAAVDIDDDGEKEVVAEMIDGPNGQLVSLDGVNGTDSDDDVIFAGGIYAFAADLNSDLQPELIFENPDATPGTATSNGPVLFLGGQAQSVADLDGDGELELVASSAALPAGFSSLVAPGVVFLGGDFLGFADIDGDGEPEALAISAVQAPGSYSLGIGLETPADLDPDIVFLPAGARGVADLDHDGELEIVAENASLTPGTFTVLGGLEGIGDSDPDVVFLGGELMLFGDLDGDGETELIVRDLTALAGSVASASGAEVPADSDADVAFLAGSALLLEDLDGDGEKEVAAAAAVASVTVARAIEVPADSDADVVFTPGQPAAVADLDGDGENELLVADSALLPGQTDSVGSVEQPADPDVDVVRVGGEVRQRGDLDGDLEQEAVIEVAGQTAATVAIRSDLETPADADSDLVFVPGGAARLVDLDGDGENELLVDGGPAAGQTLVGGSLESPADLDADVFFLGGSLRAIADLDADGEIEAIVQADLAATTSTTYRAAEAPADLDADLVYTGGRVRAIADLDGDGENEAALESAAVTPGSATVRGDLEEPADTDPDLVFVSGILQGLADYDQDGESDLVSSSDLLPGGSSSYLRDLEVPADVDADIAFLGTGLVSGVVDPNGGEIWRIGSTQAIHWNLASPGNVKVQLSRDGGATWVNLIGSTPNDGEQLWDVKGPATSQALVRVSSRDDAAITDTSDHVFTIPPASLSLTSPNGGGTFQVGSQVDITWTSANLAGGIEVTLSRDGGATWETIDPTTPNDGSKTWIVTGPATSQAIFRLRSAVDNSVADQADAASTINAPSLTVTSPNGGESLLLGSTATLTWSSSGLGGALHVDLSRDGGASWERILTNTANDGNQIWNVVGAPTTQALVRLTSVSNPAIFDLSNATFTIPVASLAVASPNGGETILLASQINLTWSSANLGGNVKIELSRNNGSTWEVLFATTPNDGIQAWRVVGAPTNQALLRVSSRNEPAIVDTSNSTFTIPAASFTLTSPNGGESWAPGTNKTITWTSSNIAGAVDLELSRDNGASWTVIVANTANDGNQSWTVTGPATTGALVRVRSIYVPIQDSSNAPFTIP